MNIDIFAKKSLLTLSLSTVMFYGGASYADVITLDDAIARTIAQHSDVKISKSSVVSAQGDVQTTQGSFDVALTGGISGSKADTATFSSTTFQESETTKRNQAYEIGVSKLFENSMSVSLANTLATERTASSPLKTVGTSEWSLTVSVPLMQGFGHDVTTATRNAAQKTLEATQLSSGHDISQQAYTAAVAYWSSLGIQLNYDNLTTAMDRASVTANTLEERQRGGELAAVEYSRSLAELRLTQVDVEDGRQKKYESQEKLALSIGNNDQDELPETVGPFPVPATPETLAKLDLKKLLNLAIDRRLDVKAQQKLIDAAGVNVMKAKDDTRPSLDLALSGGYTAARDNFSKEKTSVLYTNHDERNGPDYSVALSFSYPLGNNAANGVLSTSKQTAAQAELTLEKLRRTVRNQINIAVDKLKAAVRSYQLSAESLKLMEEVAVETARKLSFAEATMTDMISVEDRLTQGRLRMINAQSNYAQALARLRFVTGTMTTRAGDGYIIDASSFMTLPLLEMQGVGG